MLEERLQRSRLDSRIGAQNTQEGGHIRVNHASALGHTSQTVGTVRSGWQSERTRKKLGEGIGRADSTGSGQPGIMRRVEVGVGRGNAVEDLANGKSEADIESVKTHSQKETCRRQLTAVQ